MPCYLKVTWLCFYIDILLVLMLLTLRLIDVSEYIVVCVALLLIRSSVLMFV